MNNYEKLYKLDFLFKTEDNIFKLYNLIKNSMKSQPDVYTTLYLCENSREVGRCFNHLAKELEKYDFTIDSVLSINRAIIRFYNNIKFRDEKILIIPIESIEHGFDGYRISKVRFFLNMFDVL